MDYSRAAATSLKLLTAFGQDATLEILAAGTYDVATGAVTSGSSTTETRKVVLLNIDRINSGQRMRNGSFVLTGDKRCLMDASGSVPDLGGKVTVGTEVYSIIDIEDLNPGGTPVLYDMVLRK